LACGNAEGHSARYAEWQIAFQPRPSGRARAFCLLALSSEPRPSGSAFQSLALPSEPRLSRSGTQPSPNPLLPTLAENQGPSRHPERSEGDLHFFRFFPVPQVLPRVIPSVARDLLFLPISRLRRSSAIRTSPITIIFPTRSPLDCSTSPSASHPSATPIDYLGAEEIGARFNREPVPLSKASMAKPLQGV
jgi:hypothetical protein